MWLSGCRTRQAVAGTLHNVIYGNLDVEFHASLLDNEELLERVASRNAELNGLGGALGRTYLLSQVIGTIMRYMEYGEHEATKRLATGESYTALFAASNKHALVSIRHRFSNPSTVAVRSSCSLVVIRQFDMCFLIFQDPAFSSTHTSTVWNCLRTLRHTHGSS